MFGIFFTNFHLQGLEPLVIRTVRFKVEETGEVFNDKVRAYTIELPCFRGKTEADSKTRIDKWVYNLYNMENMTKPLAFQDEMPIFKRLATVAEYANMTPAEQARYDYELKQYRDHYAQMSWAIKKGLMAGEAEERIKNAVAMKKKGLSTELISEILGMTTEEVEALQ